MASLASHPESTNHPSILRMNEVKRRLGCGRSTVYRLGDAGILPQAERMAGCSSAGWLEDDVDALVESRRPAGKKPAMPVVTASAKSNHAGTRNGIEDGVVNAPARTPADTGATGVSKPAPDLVPTTLRIMGNVVYLHAPTGKLLMEVGTLSAPGRGVKLDQCAIAATADEAVESAATALLHHELEVLAPAAFRERRGSRNSK
jgi:predicted DNA-binding transcriptional regulator AlpA